MALIIRGNKGFNVDGDLVRVAGRLPKETVIEDNEGTNVSGQIVSVQANPAKTKNDKDTDRAASKRTRIVDKLVFPVTAGLVLAAILGGFMNLKPRLGL